MALLKALAVVLKIAQIGRVETEIGNDNGSGGNAFTEGIYESTGGAQLVLDRLGY